MRAAWNGKTPDFVIEGTVYTITDAGFNLVFTVDTDGTRRTVSVAKAGSHIRIDPSGIITVTEEPKNA